MYIYNQRVFVGGVLSVCNSAPSNTVAVTASDGARFSGLF